MNGVDDGWKPADKLGSSGSMIKSWDLIKQNFCERYGMLAPATLCLRFAAAGQGSTATMASGPSTTTTAASS